MNQHMGVAVVVIICALLLLTVAMKKKAEWLLNMIMRSVLGALAIYFINGGLATMGITIGIGLNGVTVLTSAILGIPGLMALYGLGFYQML